MNHIVKLWPLPLFRSNKLSPRHSLLKRQLKKYFPHSDKASCKFQRFVEAVDISYQQFDEDRILLERSLEITSEELLKRKKLLKGELETIRSAKEALRVSEERYALALRGTNDGIWDYNLQTGEFYVSERFRKIAHLAPETKFNSTRDWLRIIHPHDVSKVRQVIEKHVTGVTPHIETEHRIRQDKHEVWVRVRGLAIYDQDGKAYRVAGSITDITEQKDFEALLEYQALNDPLTGLPNRTLLQDKLKHLIKATKRNSDHNFAILFIDIDRFKNINDSLGHQKGDQLLVSIANRLLSSVREQDTVARLGGDEFCILVDHLKSLNDITNFVKKILRQLSTPFDLKGQEILTSASIGIAVSNSNYDRAEEMLRNADLAMYRAKTQGKNRYVIFDREMYDEMLRVLEIEKLIRKSLQANQFELHFQPIVSLKQNNIVACECLLRMPKASKIAIQDLIHIAEESGQIVELGEWVFRQACKFSQWLVAEEIDIRVFVNISAKQFQYGSIGDRLIDIIHETKANPNNLGVEITESILLGHEIEAIDNLKKLRAEGLHLSIDDFGTGYSSLSYLNRFPVHSLKIDRSFLTGIPRNRDNNKISEAIVRLSHSLALNVVAEGIETQEQYEFLLENRCDFAQGYYISHPVDRHDFLYLYRKYRHQI